MTELSDSKAAVAHTDNDDRSPTHLGATYTWGDAMTQEPHKDHVRLYFQNCRIPTQDHGRVTLYKDI